MGHGCSQDKDALAITERFVEEIDKTGFSISEIARRTGVDHYRIRDVLTHKQRLPTDILARSASLGLDLNYVLTGLAPHLTGREASLIRNYRRASKEGQHSGEKVGPSIT